MKYQNWWRLGFHRKPSLLFGTALAVMLIEFFHKQYMNANIANFILAEPNQQEQLSQQTLKCNPPKPTDIWFDIHWHHMCK